MVKVFNASIQSLKLQENEILTLVDSRVAEEAGGEVAQGQAGAFDGAFLSAERQDQVHHVACKWERTIEILVYT